MSADQALLNDPLLIAIRSVFENSEEREWGPVLHRLFIDIEHTRSRPAENRLIRLEDPLKVAINRVFQSERIYLSWDKVVIIGCSAGGDEALREIFKKLIYPHLPIILAMHHTQGFKFMSGYDLANGLIHKPLKIQADMAIKAGEVYFAPGDKMLGYHSTNASFNLEPRTIPSRFNPVIDHLFSAAARRFKENLVGIILSGLLRDGAAGLKDIYLNHGQVWVQSPDTALFRDMPGAALTSVPTARKLSLAEIAIWINNLSGKHLQIKSLNPFGAPARV